MTDASLARGGEIQAEIKELDEVVAAMLRADRPSVLFHRPPLTENRYGDRLPDSLLAPTRSFIIATAVEQIAELKEEFAAL